MSDDAFEAFELYAHHCALMSHDVHNRLGPGPQYPTVVPCRLHFTSLASLHRTRDRDRFNGA